MLSSQLFFRRDRFFVLPPLDLVITNNRFDEAEEFELSSATLDISKYLAIKQNSMINHKKLKEEFLCKNKQRVTKVPNDKLSSNSLIIAIHYFAVRVLHFTFGVINGVTATYIILKDSRENY